MLELQRNPPVDRGLAEALVQMWVAVTNAGGAVGFLPGVAPADVWPTAQLAFAGVEVGRDDLVVAVLEREPVGFAFLETGRHTLAPHIGTVKRLQRDPRRRGAGVGASILAEVELAASDRGLSLLTLTVRGETGREAFYGAYGYHIDGRLPARLQLADGRFVEEIHMSKSLPASGPSDHAAATDPELRIRRLDPGLPLPRYAHDGDAGLDLYAAQDVELAPGERAVVPTGVAVAVPPGHVGLVHPRSGLAARAGLGIVNAPGTVDAGYRGEVKVIVINHDLAEPVRLSHGDRIAQLVIQRVERVHVVESTTLDESVRGQGGFGSTGR